MADAVATRLTKVGAKRILVEGSVTPEICIRIIRCVIAIQRRKGRRTGGKSHLFIDPVIALGVTASVLDYHQL